MSAITIPTEVVALWGAVTGSIGASIAILNYRRDRASLRVTVEDGRLGDATGWSGMLVFVRAVNVGRRPLQVRSAGLVLATGRREDADRFFIVPPLEYPMNMTLQEGDHHQVWASLATVAEQVRLQGGRLPTHGFYDDSTGRRWVSSVPESILLSLRVAVGEAAATQDRP